VEDSRAALALLAAAWFGHPAEEMFIIGLTGTKGKTTTAHMLKAILEAAGHKVGMIGTIGAMIGQERVETKTGVILAILRVGSVAVGAVPSSFFTAAVCNGGLLPGLQAPADRRRSI
jgi:uncharacterized NAD-dependent epimerase/dehydratase family protein